MAGRAKKSNVWNYFKYNKETKKSICQVVVTRNEEAKPCETQLSWMFASNLKKHLRIQHPDSYQKFEEEESREDQLLKQNTVKPLHLNKPLRKQCRSCTLRTLGRHNPLQES